MNDIFENTETMKENEHPRFYKMCIRDRSDGKQRHTSPQQIPRYTVIIQRGVRQTERWALALHRFMLHWDVHRAFLTQQLHRLYKRHTFHINQIFQRRLAADVAAFPVPHTGFAVYLEAVMLRKLVLAPRTAFPVSYTHLVSIA